MPFPSPSRLEAFLSPHAGPSGLLVSVWSVDADGPLVACALPRVPAPRAPPRIVLLGASRDGLVVVRQRRSGSPRYEGDLVPWAQVRSLERLSHPGRDYLSLDLVGREGLTVAVSDHVLLPRNRDAACVLHELVQGPRETLPVPVGSGGLVPFLAPA